MTADRPMRPEATARQRDAPSGVLVFFAASFRVPSEGPARSGRPDDGLPRGARNPIGPVVLRSGFPARRFAAPRNEERSVRRMFDSLSERLNAVLDRLTRRGALSEADVDAALREVRRALLEADVALDVARAFTDQVKKRAVGVEVIKSVTPGQMVVKIVHDQLVETLGASADPIDLNAPAPVAIMMVGLQGSGKTTTTAKIAKRLTEQRQAQGADGLARHAPPGRDGAARRARPAGRRRHAADRRRPDAAADRARALRGGPARRLRRGACSTPPAALTLDEAMMAEAAEVKPRRRPARGAAGRRRAHRPGRRQPRARASTSASGSPASCSPASTAMAAAARRCRCARSPASRSS